MLFSKLVSATKKSTRLLGHGAQEKKKCRLVKLNKKLKFKKAPLKTKK